MKPVAVHFRRTFNLPGSRLHGKQSIILEQDNNAATYKFEVGPEGVLIIDAKLGKACLAPFSSIESVILRLPGDK